MLRTMDGSRSRSIPVRYRPAVIWSNRAVHVRRATTHPSCTTVRPDARGGRARACFARSMDIALSHTPLFETDERRRAVTTLTLAVLAGGATQALFWHTGFGLNFWIWDLFVVGASVLTLRRGKVRPTAWGAIGAATFLGFTVVRYESAWTLAIATPATLAILAVLPLLLRDRYSLADLSRVPARALGSLRYTRGAVTETARLPGIAAGGEGRGVLRGMTRGLLLGVPTAGLFTLLLATDTDFARSLARVREELGDAVLFAGWSLASAAGYVFTHALHGRHVAPQSAAADDRGPYRAAHDAEAPAAAPAARVSIVTWAMVIGQVTLVFGLFVAANLRHLFGGVALVRAPGALTYATYLHAGFAELLVATILSVCLVLAGHALLRPRGERAPFAPVPGGRLLASLEAALLVLTGITVASCWQRLRIYEDAYGASHLRLGVAFVELTVLGVLALTIVKVVARRWTGHAGAVLAFGALVAVLASGFNADAYVARTNLDRAANGKPLDLAYLASLSGDAWVALDHPVVRADESLSSILEASFCGPREGGLRSFRGLGRCSGRGERSEIGR